MSVYPLPLSLSRAVVRTIDVLLMAGKVDGLDAAHLLLGGGSGGSAGDGRGTHQTGGGDESAPLDGGRRQLAGQWRAKRLAEAAGGHGDGNWGVGMRECGREQRGFGGVVGNGVKIAFMRPALVHRLRFAAVIGASESEFFYFSILAPVCQASCHRLRGKERWLVGRPGGAGSLAGGSHWPGGTIESGAAACGVSAQQPRSFRQRKGRGSLTQALTQAPRQHAPSCTAQSTDWTGCAGGGPVVGRTEDSPEPGPGRPNDIAGVGC